MDIGLNRISLYAWLSAIESDLRFHILSSLGARPPEKVFDEALLELCLARYAKEQGNLPCDISTDDLVNYLDFADACKVLMRNANSLPARTQLEVTRAHPHLTSMIPVRNRVMHVRPLEFDDFSNVRQWITEFLRRSPDFWRNLGQAELRVQNDPAYLAKLQLPKHAPRSNEPLHNLPIPDFEETGFVGREDYLNGLHLALKGPYPVVTVTGEGGLGKTSIALRAAYDLLDSADDLFDAIVWATAKTRSLSTEQIIEIEDAISSSLGILEAWGNALGGSDSAKAIDDLLQYLEQFRILLILDNLETVVDEALRQFLARLPKGSKLLITSRVGLGAFEYPIRLDPLSEKEAVQLLRAMARSRRITSLTKASNEELRDQCKKMFNNPGYIKWFVAAVQAGRRPEDILANPALFLEYCMSNVYQNLGNEAKNLIATLQCLVGQRTMAELSIIGNTAPEVVVHAINELNSTNMISVVNQPRGGTYETRYQLTEMARRYLVDKHPVPSQQREAIQRRVRNLIAEEAAYRAEERRNPYSMFAFKLRTKKDILVTKRLQDALARCNEKRHEEALAIVEELKILAPDYHEVFKIDAFIKAQLEEHVGGALESWRIANQLDPRNAAIKLFYGQFMLRKFDDSSRALELVKEAFELDPNALPIQHEIAKLYMFEKDFVNARKVLDILGRGLDDMDIRMRSKTVDLSLQFYARKADDLAIHHDYEGSMSALEALTSAFQCLTSGVIDDQIIRRLNKTNYTARRILMGSVPDDAKFRAGRYLAWLNDVTDSYNRNSETTQNSFVGTVAKLEVKKNFGVIKERGGEVYTFIKSQVRDDGFKQLKIGDTVLFQVDELKGKKIAVDVRNR